MWVLSVAMENKVERSHIGFLRHVMGKQVRRIVDGMWDTPGAEVVQEYAGTQSVMTSIGIRQATVALWVVLRPIFEVCAG